MSTRSGRKKQQVVGLLGVGLDNKDGHQRVTRSEGFLLVGGSQETHERMQDVVIHFSEGLKERGKRLADVTPKEVLELLDEAADR